jgi:hypothetical protein
MQRVKHWGVWKFYLIFYCLFSVLNLFYFFFPDSPNYRYYQIAIAFNIYFFGTYFINLTVIVLNALSIVPLLLYTFHIRFLSQTFWRWFFVIRLALDLLGHNYEINLFKSLAHDNLWLGIRFILSNVMLAIPSYIALFDYAFGQSIKKSKN